MDYSKKTDMQLVELYVFDYPDNNGGDAQQELDNELKKRGLYTFAAELFNSMENIVRAAMNLYEQTKEKTNG
jgi:hypothetical protein